MKKYWFGVLYGLLLAAFTGYVLLDAFVFRTVYQSVPPAQSAASDVEAQGTAPEEAAASGESFGAGQGRGEESAQEEPEAQQSAADEPVVSGSRYADGQIEITVTEYERDGTTVYVADVRLSAPEYLKTAFAQAAYGKNVTEKTSEIAAANGAILAINGDYYGARERGYVLRNGVLYRDTASPDQEDLVIYQDGSFGVAREGDVDAQTLLSEGAAQILSFGPALVRGGEIAVTEAEEVGRARASNPRTAIAVVDALHYLLVVADGRTEESEGLSLYELAAFLRELGASLAYNLDGGGSSTMVFNGEVVNRPTSSGRSIRERSVSDIVYIGY